MRDSSSIIYGRNPVREALSAGASIDRLFVLDKNEEGPLGRIVSLARKKGIRVDFVSRERLDEITQNAAHQGVCAYAAAYSYSSVDDILNRAEEKDEAPFVIMLDGIVDPHNLGAIIRSANCFGAHGVIIPKDNAAGLTESAVKASAGAVSYTPVARVVNLSRTLEELKEKGLWSYCADMGGEDIGKTDLSGPVCLVIGNEGQGVSALLKKKCDFTVKIPLCGNIDSLNASVAAGIFMYEISKKRG